jgi:hypothetical protein
MPKGGPGGGGNGGGDTGVIKGNKRDNVLTGTSADDTILWHRPSNLAKRRVLTPRAADSNCLADLHGAVAGCRPSAIFRRPRGRRT